MIDSSVGSDWALHFILNHATLSIKQDLMKQNRPTGFQLPNNKLHTSGHTMCYWVNCFSVTLFGPCRHLHLPHNGCKKPNNWYECSMQLETLDIIPGLFPTLDKGLSTLPWIPLDLSTSNPRAQSAHLFVGLLGARGLIFPILKNVGLIRPWLTRSLVKNGTPHLHCNDWMTLRAVSCGGAKNDPALRSRKPNQSKLVSSHIHYLIRKKTQLQINTLLHREYLAITSWRRLRWHHQLSKKYV